MRGRRLGFDFSAHMECFCRDISERLPDMRHIDMDRVCVTFAQARKRQSWGTQASLTPLRFAGGSLVGLRQGRRYQVERLFHPRGHEYLYILTFYLPRFMDLDFGEKCVTIFHELWHIGPRCDGDLRRHPGRCYVHTRSEEQYDAEMARKALRYLAARPPAALYQFLHASFDDLCRRHGRVFGTRLRQPQLIPL